jgi:hypothetical protein
MFKFYYVLRVVTELMGQVQSTWETIMISIISISVLPYIGLELG